MPVLHMHGQLIRHPLPADFAKHPNTPWDALSAIVVGPFIISIDSFGAASNVWSVDADGIKFVTTLQPPLPSNILTSRAKGIYSGEYSLIAIGFDVRSISTTLGILRLYNLPNGRLQQEVVLHGLALGQVFTTSPSCTYFAAALCRPWQIDLYQMHSHGLTKIRCLKPPSITPCLASFFPVHVGDDGTVLASSTFVPSPSLLLTLYPPTASTSDTREAILTLRDNALDWLVPSSTTLVSPSSLVVAVSGTASRDDHLYTKSSVYTLSLPSLSITSKLDLEHGVTQLSYHSMLRSVIAVHADSHHASLAFIDMDDHEGCTLRRIVTLPPFPDTPHVPPCVQCTDDEFMCILPTGKIFVESLQRILESDISEDAPAGTSDEEEVVLKMQTMPVKPKPFNAKARKQQGRWRWVDNVAFVPGGVVVLPVRGPELLYIHW